MRLQVSAFREHLTPDDREMRCGVVAEGSLVMAWLHRRSVAANRTERIATKTATKGLTPRGVLGPLWRTYVPLSRL